MNVITIKHNKIGHIYASNYLKALFKTCKQPVIYRREMDFYFYPLLFNCSIRAYASKCAPVN